MGDGVKAFIEMWTHVPQVQARHTTETNLKKSTFVSFIRGLNSYNICGALLMGRGLRFPLFPSVYTLNPKWPGWGIYGRRKPKGSPSIPKGQILFISLNNFNFFFTLQPLGLIFFWPLVPESLALFWCGEGQVQATISPSHQPHPPPFPFSSYSGFSGHCNLALPSEHKSRGHSSGLFEKLGLCGAFPRGHMGKEGEEA